MKSRTFAILAFFALPSFLLAESEKGADVSPAPYFVADKAMTLQGKLEAANRYQQADFSQFNAGNGLVLSDSGGFYGQGANATLKGVAFFDLDANNMRNTLSNLGDLHLILSFYVMQIKGKPRPLRVEYVGTFKDVEQSDSLSKIFQASPLKQVNNVLRRSGSNGMKLVDMTQIASQSLENRWLVIRWEQEGLRIQNTGQDDLYQMSPEAASVRLTLSTKDAAGKNVAQSYTKDGYHNLLSDMPKNLISDMPKNLLEDMPDNPIQDGNNQ